MRRLKNPRSYIVLHKRYVEHKDLQTVADEMDMSYSGITTLHGRALKELQEIIDD